MSLTNYPLGVPMLDATGKVVFPITHVKNVIGAAPKENPEFSGTITYNGKILFSVGEEGKINPLPAEFGGTGSSTGVTAESIKKAMGWDATNGIIPTTEGGTGNNYASFDAMAAAVAVALYGATKIVPTTSGGTGNNYTDFAALASAVAVSLYGANKIVPTTAGGTGANYSNLTAMAKAVVESYYTGGIVPIEKGGTGATSAANALAALGGCSAVRYEITVPTTSWSTITNGFSKVITVTGMLATDIPIVGLVSSTTMATAKTQMEAFSCINKITTAANQITCYCLNSVPTTQVTIQLLCIRGYK